MHGHQCSSPAWSLFIRCRGIGSRRNVPLLWEGPGRYYSVAYLIRTVSDSMNIAWTWCCWVLDKGFGGICACNVPHLRPSEFWRHCSYHKFVWTTSGRLVLTSWDSCTGPKPPSGAFWYCQKFIPPFYVFLNIFAKNCDVHYIQHLRFDLLSDGCNADFF